MSGDIEARIFEVVASSKETGETGGNSSRKIGAVGKVFAVFDKNLQYWLELDTELNRFNIL